MCQCDGTVHTRTLQATEVNGGKVKKIFITFIIILFFSLLNITKLISIENLGQIGECYLNGGFCRETKIIDNIAYVGCQYGLIILDISSNVKLVL